RIKSDGRRQSDLDELEGRLREWERTLMAAQERLEKEAQRLAEERARQRSEREEPEAAAEDIAHRQVELQVAESALALRTKTTRGPQTPGADDDDDDASDRTVITTAPTASPAELQAALAERDQQIDDLRYELDFYMRRDAKAMAELDRLRRQVSGDRARA